MSLRTKMRRKKFKRRRTKRIVSGILELSPEMLTALKKTEDREDEPSLKEETAAANVIDRLFASEAVSMNLLSPEERLEFKNLSLWQDFKCTEAFLVSEEEISNL